MTSQYKKPLPNPYNKELSAPFWEAAKRHELLVQRCKHCETLFFYPREACPRCLFGLERLEWVKVGGKGRVYTYTIVHQPASGAFLDDVPYIFGVIQLDEGPRMPGNVIGLADPHLCFIGMPVQVVFDDATPEWTLPRWQPA